MIPTSPPSAHAQGETADAELENCIKSIAAGDKEALSELYKKTAPAVYGLSLSLLKNPHDAEDVLQDAYVKIWESAPNYQAMGKPLAWIFTITRNLALMSLRRQTKTSPADPADLNGDSRTAGTEGPEDRLVLKSVLSDLEEEDQMIVIMHAVGGMKHREIAEMLQMPLSTVLSRYSRALKKLRDILEEAK